MIDADRSPGQHDSINDAIQLNGVVPRSARTDLLAPYVASSIQAANEDRLSLAIVEPLACPELHFVHDPASPDSPHLRLFYGADDSRPSDLRRFPFIPRLRFHDEGGSHNLMLRDWGAFEFLRKFPSARHDLAGALHLDASVSLLVGNFNAHRNSWCVISVLRGVRSAGRVRRNKLTLEIA